MIKESLDEIINDCKSKRDAVAMMHSQLKADADGWNKGIILLSLITGGVESIKMKLELTAPCMVAYSSFIIFCNCWV